MPGDLETAVEYPSSPDEGLPTRDEVVEELRKELTEWVFFDVGEKSATHPDLWEFSHEKKPKGEVNIDLIEEFAQLMYRIEHENFNKNLDQVTFVIDEKTGEKAEDAFLKRYQQATALGLEVEIDPSVAHVLGLDEETIEE